MLKYVKVRDVKDPNRGTLQSAGIDLFIPNDITLQELNEKSRSNIFARDGGFLVHPQHSVLIPSGLHFNVPKGHALIAFNKSGVATKLNLDISASVVDEDYEGEVHISLTNAGDQSVVIMPGQKIVQFVLLPVNYAEPTEVSSLEDLYSGSESQRGSGGFGSTGDK